MFIHNWNLHPRKMWKLDPFFAVCGFLSLILRILVPANIYTNAGHDDYLGIQLAHNLLNGKWLGEWDNRTLLKPSGYSFYLAITHFIPVEPQILLHMIYLCVIAYFVWIIKRVFPLNTISTVLTRFSFALLAFNPMFYSADFSRIYRMSLNVVIALALILVILHFWFIVIGNENLKINRLGLIFRNEKRTYSFFGALIGLLYAGLVFTRTEAIWILFPVLLVLFFYIIFALIKYDPKLRKSKLGIVFLSFAVAILSFTIPVESVKLINYKAYGAYTLENYYSGEFARAISLWTSVKGTKNSPTFIPIDSSKRAIVYSQSATAQKMEKFLETPANTGWKIPNCQQSSICDESGPWFPFELRDAATLAFGIKSERQFQNTFRQISDDIESACASRTITCLRKGSSTGTINFLDLSKRQLVNDLAIYFGSLLDMNQASQLERLDGGSDLTQLTVWSSVIKMKRTYMTNDTQYYLVLGDFLSELREIYSKVYLILFLVFLLVCFSPRYLLSISGQIKVMLYFLLTCILMYGGGMGIFHSATNIPASNSFYTQPAAPIFLIMLLLSAHLAISGFKVNLTPNSHDNVLGKIEE
jgi:hypothetical protein